MGGDETIKKGKITRPCVRRIIMGGKEQFSTQLVQDELSACTLCVWAVLTQEDSAVDAHAFGTALGLPDGFLFGSIKKCPPDELSRSCHWTDTGYFSFSGAEAWLDHAYHSVYICMIKRIYLPLKIEGL